MPTKELYDDIIKPPNLCGLDEAIDSDGNMIISDSRLRGFFPQQVKLMSKKIRLLLFNTHQPVQNDQIMRWRSSNLGQ